MDGVDFYALPPAQQQAILNSAALEAPDGQQSHLPGEPPNSDYMAHIVLSICVALSSIAISCRIYMRFVVLKQFKFVGDWLLILGYAIMIVDFGITYRMTVVPGAFVHQWDVRLSDFIYFLHDVFITSQIYILVILPVKIAILLEWHRIFAPPGTRGFVFWASHVMIFALLGFYLSTIVAFNVACEPIEYNWNILLNGSCDRVDTKLTNLSTSVFNFISDILILLIPQRAIWKLNLSARKKAGVSVVFAIGILGCVCSLIRLVETVRHAESPDFTYTFSGIMLCSGAEVTCAFLVVSGPCFPKAFSSINLSKLRSGWRFSSRSKLFKSSKRHTETSWPRSEYSRMERNGKVDTEMVSLQILPTAQFPTHFADVSVNDNIGFAGTGGIVRTTQFGAVEVYDTNGLLGTERKRQENWAV